MSMKTLVRCRSGLYRIRGQVTAEALADIAATALMESVVAEHKVTEAKQAARLLQLLLAHEENEHFAALFLDNQHHVLRFERLFSGTIDSVNVYPRVVVQKALACNAAAVIFAHNHPSNSGEPSASDRRITAKLLSALSLIDVRVLDHFVVTRTEAISMAELGLI